jgi:hypothetical protein
MVQWLTTNYPWVAAAALTVVAAAAGQLRGGRGGGAVDPGTDDQPEPEPDRVGDRV